MEIKNNLYSILQCPITGDELDLVDRNSIILKKEPLDGKISSYLQNKRKSHLYPISDGIIFLLPDHAIETSKVKKTTAITYSQQVQQFYNNIGWKQESENYKDAHIFEDLRTVSQEYIYRSHMRINNYLTSGNYLLDIASGPVQFDEYLTYSDKFKLRICADISITALKKAKQKLGDNAIYILADLCNLPFKDNSLDNILSLHTIYHIPKVNQIRAFKEIYRAIKQNGKGIIAYSWGRHSIIMRLFTLPRIIYKKLTKRFCTKKKSYSLYFYSFSYRTLMKQLQDIPISVFCWRSLNVAFLKLYIHKFLFGRFLLKGIFKLENLFPQTIGKLGEYPLIIIYKNDESQ